MAPLGMSKYAYRIEHPPAGDSELAGRALAIWFRLAEISLTVVTVYAHTNRNGIEASKPTERIWNWVRQVLQNRNCITIILTDCNGHTGIAEKTAADDPIDMREVLDGRGERRQDHRNSGIGPSGAVRENRNGTLFRKFLDDTGCWATNTFWATSGTRGPELARTTAGTRW